MNSDDVRREEAARPRDGSLPQGSGVRSSRPDPASRSSEFAASVFRSMMAIPEPFTREYVCGFVVELLRVRESILIDKCRRAIQAERNYQAVLHNRVGSKYGRERRNREIEEASRLREQTAREVEL